MNESIPVPDSTDILKSIRLDKFKSRAFEKILLKILKLDRMKDVYTTSTEKEGVEFVDAILKKLKVSYECKPEELEHIPKLSPFILLSNHPFGGIDGLILLSIILRKRPDFKIMANYLLESLPRLQGFFIPVNPFEKKKGEQINVAGIKKSLRHLEEGMPVGVFPAGEVSSFNLNKFRVSDKTWEPIVGKMILRSGVSVVPVYFSGNNSILFNILGMIHPQLRTARLPSELFNKSGSLTVRIGKPISAETLKEFDSSDQMLRFLRAKTYSLGTPIDVKSHFRIKGLGEPKHKTILEPSLPALLRTEVDKLRGTKSLMFSQAQFSVFSIKPFDAPHILREIFLLRERTFREVGEGTGQAYDGDEFDLHYRHLFVWDNTMHQIAGAYRVGEGYKIFRQYKRSGFYLNTLFRLSKNFDEILQNSLELGRSFVVKEYQKSSVVLLLLWKAVYQLAGAKPDRYKYLIGPVSISNRFTNLSKDVLVSYIRKHHFDHNMAEYITPRKKFQYSHKGEADDLMASGSKNIHLLDQIVSDIEPANTKVPVLIKKYLQQNAKIIGFNVDPRFNHALDGLVVMKLKDLPQEAFDLLS